MKRTITVDSIPLFRFMNTESRKRLQKALVSKTLGKGDQIITAGQPVEGIYVLCEGHARVYLPDLPSPLSISTAGASFGEMAILEESQVASADVVSGSDETFVLFYPKEQVNIDLKDTYFAKGFFRGAAALLTERLRETNLRVVSEVRGALDRVQKLMEGSKFDLKIQHTQGQIDETGEQIVGNLIGVMPMIEEISEKAPELSNTVDQVRMIIEHVSLVESQRFDRISQEINLLGQYFDNMRKMANGEPLSAIYGDENLFAG